MVEVWQDGGREHGPMMSLGAAVPAGQGNSPKIEVRPGPDGGTSRPKRQPAGWCPAPAAPSRGIGDGVMISLAPGERETLSPNDAPHRCGATRRARPRPDGRSDGQSDMASTKTRCCPGCGVSGSSRRPPKTPLWTIQIQGAFSARGCARKGASPSRPRESAGSARWCSPRLG